MMKGKRDFDKFVEELKNSAISGDKEALRRVVEAEMFTPVPEGAERPGWVFTHQEDQYWCLRAAVEKRFNLLLRVLLELGADPDYQPAGRPSVASIAAQGGYLYGVALLMRAGVDIDLPLQAALLHGSRACTLFILKHGEWFEYLFPGAKRLYRKKVFTAADIKAMLTYINRPDSGFGQKTIEELEYWADHLLRPRPARPRSPKKAPFEDDENHEEYFRHLSNGGQLWEKDVDMVYADKLLRKGFREEAFGIYESASCGGWGCVQFRALYMLGWCYIGGLGVEEDFEKGCEYWEQALEFAEELEHEYHWGMYHVMNQPDGRVWREVQQAMEMDSYEIACEFLAGSNPFYCEEAGVKWLKSAAEDGDSRAMADLGERYLKSRAKSVREQGIRLLRQAVAEGCQRAQRVLDKAGVETA